MKKRILFLTSVLLMCAVLLCSCSDIFGGSSNDGKPEYKRIVYVDENLDLFSIRTGVSDILGVTPTVTDSEAAIDGEIVFGDSNRAITAKAKAALADELSGTENDCGYIIYAEGNNVAVYWQHPDMADIAVAKFASVCIAEKRLVLDEGSVMSEHYVKAIFEKEKYWLALEAQAPADVVSSLKKIYNYYNGPKLIEWLANLYDPDRGAFYYSRSARDNDPFRPDIESTAQAMNFILNNNALKNRNQLPNDIKLKMIEFARNMQSPVDGGFYHEQWAQSRDELAVDRFGRDQGWATSTITDFLADSDGDGIDEAHYPKWCAVNGVKCKEHTINDGHCIFPQSASYYSKDFENSVTTSLTSSVSSAVAGVQSSVVTPTAASKPNYSSRAAFTAWLEEYNETVKEDSGRAHQLASMRSEIAQKGYADIVMNHLDRVQKEVYEEQIKNGEEPTGLWQRNVDYNAVWGLLKYMSFYNASGYGRKIDIKYVPHIAKTVVKVIALEPNGDYASNDLYNQWSGVSNLISNVRKHYGDDGVQQIYDVMRENCVSLIDNSLKKIEPFRMRDGSFSARSTGMTGANIYGTNIALGVSEGNVNSTGLICSMYRSIYSALGYSVVPLCVSDDGETFIDIISNCEPIDKNRVDAELDFENGKMPGSVILNIKNEGASATVEDDPTGSENKALYFVSTEGESAGDGLEFATTGSGESCYVFESRIYIDADSDDGLILQIKLDSAYMIVFTKSEETITIKDSATTKNQSLKSNVIGTASTNTWFKIRAEYYVNGEENGINTPRIKLFVDDEYAITTDNFFGSHTAGKAPNNSYSKVNVLSPQVKNSKIYFDNCFFSKEGKTYNESDNQISDSRG